jgi:hypothetical protein
MKARRLRRQQTTILEGGLGGRARQRDRRRQERTIRDNARRSGADADEALELESDGDDRGRRARGAPGARGTARTRGEASAASDADHARGRRHVERRLAAGSRTASSSRATRPRAPRARKRLRRRIEGEGEGEGAEGEGGAAPGEGLTVLEGRGRGGAPRWGHVKPSRARTARVHEGPGRARGARRQGIYNHQLQQEVKQARERRATSASSRSVVEQVRGARPAVQRVPRAPLHRRRFLRPGGAASSRRQHARAKLRAARWSSWSASARTIAPDREAAQADDHCGRRCGRPVEALQKKYPTIKPQEIAGRVGRPHRTAQGAGPRARLAKLPEVVELIGPSSRPGPPNSMRRDRASDPPPSARRPQADQGCRRARSGKQQENQTPDERSPHARSRRREAQAPVPERLRRREAAARKPPKNPQEAATARSIERSLASGA